MTTVPDYDLQAALNDRLSDEFPTMPVAWENRSFTPVVGTPYLKANLLRADSEVITLGPNPYKERRGIFQVSCMYPAGEGWGNATSKAAEVAAAFPDSSSFVYNGLTVNIVESTVNSGLPGDGWYMVPVSIRYSCTFRG